MRRAFEIVRKTVAGFGEDKATRLAAEIAFATIFAIAPLMIILIAVLGAFIGLPNGSPSHRAAEDQLLRYISTYAGRDAANAIAQIVATAFNKPRASVITQIAGWSMFAVGASGLFGSLQDALNAVWRIEATRGGWLQMLRDRIASFAMIAVVAFVLMVSFGVNAALSFAQAHYLGNLSRVTSSVLLQVIDGLVLFGIVTAVFAAIFKVLPDVSLRWRDVWVGAAVTGALFLVGEELIAVYMSVAGISSGYGAAGSLLVALIWIYYSAMILLLGAEFTKVQAGEVQTQAPTALRTLVERPSGVDPREVAPSSGQRVP